MPVTQKLKVRVGMCVYVCSNPKGWATIRPYLGGKMVVTGLNEGR